MSTKFDYTNRKRIRGTHRMLFALGASQATQYSVPYRDMGNMVDMGLQPSTEKYEDYDMVGGEKVAVPPSYLSKVTDFNVKLSDLDKKNLKLMLRGEDAPSISQSSLSAQEVDVLDFTTLTFVQGHWYPITHNGVPVYKITELTIAETVSEDALVEGTDFEYLPDLGMVRFLTDQSVSLTLTATAAEFSNTPFRIGEGDPLTGMSLIRTYIEKHSKAEAALLYKPFGSYIEYEEAMNIVVDSNTEATVKVRVTHPAPELVDFRE